jgi:integrase
LLTDQHHLRRFQVRRAGIECFACDLEARGRARATISRRLCTIAGLYKYAVEEDLLDHSLAAHVRRPRLDYDSHATALDRNELGALLVAAGRGSPGEQRTTPAQPVGPCRAELLCVSECSFPALTTQEPQHRHLQAAPSRQGDTLG